MIYKNGQTYVDINMYMYIYMIYINMSDVCMYNRCKTNSCNGSSHCNDSFANHCSRVCWIYTE